MLQYDFISTFTLWNNDLNIEFFIWTLSVINFLQLQILFAYLFCKHADTIISRKLELIKFCSLYPKIAWCSKIKVKWEKISYTPSPQLLCLIQMQLVTNEDIMICDLVMLLCQSLEECVETKSFKCVALWIVAEVLDKLERWAKTIKDADSNILKMSFSILRLFKFLLMNVPFLPYISYFLNDFPSDWQLYHSQTYKLVSSETENLPNPLDGCIVWGKSSLKFLLGTATPPFSQIFKTLHLPF